jgi:hypothetical protein
MKFSIFDFYLRNTPFTAVVDHQALLALLNQKEPTGKFARWVPLFQMYPMMLVYRQGSKHGNADALSLRVYTSKFDDTLATDAVLAIDDVDQVTHHATTVPDLLPDMPDIKRLQRADIAFKDIIDYLE